MGKWRNMFYYGKKLVDVTQVYCVTYCYLSIAIAVRKKKHTICTLKNPKQARKR